jgi:hypothetical protein
MRSSCRVPHNFLILLETSSPTEGYGLKGATRVIIHEERRLNILEPEEALRPARRCGTIS